MKLITVEDYAALNNISVQEVYVLIGEGKLKIQASEHYQLRLKNHINLVYVDEAPKNIVSLEGDVEYLSQKETA